MSMHPTEGLPVIRESKRDLSTRRPAWLGTVCCLAMVLGLLGIAHASGSLYLFGYGGGMAILFPPADRWEKPSNRTELFLVQRNDVQVVIDRYREEFAMLLARHLPTALLFDGARLLVSCTMVYGAIQCLRLNFNGKWILAKALLAALLLDGWGAIFSTQLFFAELSLLDEFRNAVVNVRSESPMDLFRFDALRWASWACMIVIYVLLAAKLVFYTISLHYLSLRSVCESFQRAMRR